MPLDFIKSKHCSQAIFLCFCLRRVEQMVCVLPQEGLCDKTGELLR